MIEDMSQELYPEFSRLLHIRFLDMIAEMRKYTPHITEIEDTPAYREARPTSYTTTLDGEVSEHTLTQDDYIWLNQKVDLWIKDHF